MADFTLKQNDDFTITDTLEDASGNPVNLQGATVTLTMLPAAGGPAKLDAAAASVDQVGDGSDGSKGNVSFTGTSADSDTAGTFLAAWTVTYSDGTVQSFPNGDWILIQVTADAPVDTGTRFVDSTDLEARLGLTFTAAEHIRANTLLELATALIQDEARQTITLVTDDTITMPGTTEDRILLPERPVVSVSSVTVDGNNLAEGTSWYLDGPEIVRVTSSYSVLVDGSLNAPFLLGTGFGWPRQTIEIVYTHGYAADDIPSVAKTICLEAVVRVWVNPGAVAREEVGNVRTVYDNMRFSPTGLLLTDDECAAIRRFFGRRAVSVSIGS